MENNIQEPEVIVEEKKPSFEKSSMDAILKRYGPKLAFRKNLLLSTSGGWRAGYTKPTVEDRVMKNRRKERNRRKVRQAQRAAGYRVTN